MAKPKTANKVQKEIASSLTYKDLSIEARSELASKIFEEASQVIAMKTGLRIVPQMAYAQEGIIPRLSLVEIKEEKDETNKQEQEGGQTEKVSA